MSSPAAPYRTPAQLRKAAGRLRRISLRNLKTEPITSSECELLRKAADTLEALAAGHDVVVQTSITLEPKP